MKKKSPPKVHPQDTPLDTAHKGPSQKDNPEKKNVEERKARHPSPRPRAIPSANDAWLPPPAPEAHSSTNSAPEAHSSTDHAPIAATSPAIAAVLRAAPDDRQERGDLDEVAASFRRAVGDLVDRRLEEILPSIAGLYHRLEEEARAIHGDPSPLEREDLVLVLQDASNELAALLRLLGGRSIAPAIGDPYDPLVHLAVGEAVADGGEPASGSGGTDGVVARLVRPGYQSRRGRVVLPARVLIGRG